MYLSASGDVRDAANQRGRYYGQWETVIAMLQPIAVDLTGAEAYIRKKFRDSNCHFLSRKCVHLILLLTCETWPPKSRTSEVSILSLPLLALNVSLGS